MKYKNPYSINNYLKRVGWQISWLLLVRPLPRRFGSNWKRYIINLWGGKIAKGAVIYSSAKIFEPWNLTMQRNSCIGNNVIIYNAASIILEENAIVSQHSYLCTASHDIYTDKFTLFSKPIIIKRNAWVAAKCFIGPGVTIGDGAVVGATASVYKDVASWTVVGGNPAKTINKRVINDI